MENQEKICRHEYVKIFQRKYKNYARRLVATRGYLPTGFSNKDFSFLNSGALCFCTKCRLRLFPARKNQSKIEPTTIANPAIEPEVLETENKWLEENTETNVATSQEIAVEELQVEDTDVSDIVDKEIAANQEDDDPEQLDGGA